MRCSHSLSLRLRDSYPLTSLHTATRRLILQKARHHRLRGCDILSVYGFRFCFTPLAGVLFAFPSRYLSAIGSCGVFSLGSWSTRIPAGFHVPRRTQVPHQRVLNISHTRLSRSSAGLPRPFRYVPVFSQLPGSSPCGPSTPYKWFGLLPFRSPLLWESLLISFPELLRWFTSLSMALPDYFIHPSQCTDRSVRVTPFGNPGINGYVLLPPAFRSLSRPSSPRSSQASTINLFLA